MSQGLQRPTQHEFRDAAFCFDEGIYPHWTESSKIIYTMRLANLTLICMRPTIHQPSSRTSRAKDAKTIDMEREAEGIVIGEEDLRVFARSQVARYDQLSSK